MAKAPGFYLYTGDWMKDPELSACSEATRGIWIDFLCAMHEKRTAGTLAGTTEQLARISRTTPRLLARALTELSATGTAIIQRQADVVSVTCRRIERESHAREKARERKQNERFRKKSRESHSASSISSLTGVSKRTEDGSLSLPESPPASVRERAPKSAFSLEDCLQYAASLKSIKSPVAYAKTIWRSGEDDEQIAAFLEPKAQIAEIKKPVDVDAIRRLADELERMEHHEAEVAALRAAIKDQ